MISISPPDGQGYFASSNGFNQMAGHAPVAHPSCAFISNRPPWKARLYLV